MTAPSRCGIGATSPPPDIGHLSNKVARVTVEVYLTTGWSERRAYATAAIPVVSAAVGAGARKTYGTYRNRLMEAWPDRRIDEPSPSDLKQMATYTRNRVVSRRNARGGHSAAEHFVSAVRCLYKHAVDDGLISEADNPARDPEAAPTVQHTPGPPRDRPGRDQPGRGNHGQRPGAGQSAAAPAHRDRIPPRRRPGTPAL
jgi:hypothetical protein